MIEVWHDHGFAIECFKKKQKKPGTLRDKKNHQKFNDTDKDVLCCLNILAYN